MVIVLSILFPFIFLGVILFIFFSARIVDSKKSINVKGTLLFQLDLNRRLIRRYEKISNNNFTKEIFGTHKKGWVKLENLTMSFVGTSGEKKIRSSFASIMKQDNEISFSFNTKNVFKKSNTSFFFKLNKLQDSSLINLELSWHKMFSKKSFKKTPITILKQEVAENPSTYKGFIGFGLNGMNERAEEQFITDLRIIFRHRSIDFFFSQGMFVVPFFGNKVKVIRKKMLFFETKIIKKGYQIGINRLFIGSGKILNKDIDTSKRINIVLKALDFIINLSMINKINFMSNENKLFKNENYHEFIRASQIFRGAIKSGNIKTEYIKIKNSRTRKTVIEYAFPSIAEISTKNLEMILKNKFNRFNLIDAHINKIGVEGKIDRPVLIDINAYWLIANKYKLKNKKAIYVLNFRHFEYFSAIEAIRDMKKRGFIFAIRVARFNEEKSTLIKNIKPHFIVVDSILSNSEDPAKYIQLISLKKLSTVEKAKIIYEQPTIPLNDIRAKTIGLQFYYKFN